MRDRGVEVLEMHDLLADDVGDPEARAWVLDRKIIDELVGAARAGRDPGLAGRDARRRAGRAPHRRYRHQRSARRDLRRLLRGTSTRSGFVMPPLPNTLFTRDKTCWIFGGVTLNPMYWPARRQETLLTTAIYKFHPSFADAEFDVWFGDPDVDHGAATLEGGDVMPIGKGVVLIGMGERTSLPGGHPGGARRCSQAGAPSG